MRLKDLLELTNEYEEEIIEYRRYFHENPELSFQEEETSKKIRSILDSWEVPYDYPVAKTGIIAYLKGGKPGKTIMVRGDIDALPVKEDTGLPFSSKHQGIMHACGHDAHTANLLGVIKVLKPLIHEFSGNIKFLFQPAEEAGGGGREVVKEGYLEDVDYAIGLHVMPEEGGHIKISPGYNTAYSDGFQIKVTGKNAHTSKPQEGVDAIYVAAKLIDALYGINAKNLDPKEIGTFSIGHIEGGTAPNIVPEEVTLKGMMRTLSKETRESLKTKIEEITLNYPKVFGAKGEFQFKPGYPSVYNDPNLVEKAYDFLKNNYRYLLEDINSGIIEDDVLNFLDHSVDPRLGAEDFGFYAQEVPSLFIWVGTGLSAPQHNPKFTIDERYLKLCTRILSILTLVCSDNEEVIQ
ncbi:MAG: amidohydrolase [Tissierellia bacterium]|nr:amidohydrolase [Tissierellia bacterium]